MKRHYYRYAPGRSVTTCFVSRSGFHDKTEIMKHIVLTIFFLFSVFSASAQQELDRLLGEIEKNNPELSALRMLRDANSVSTYVGNSLENPEVEFGYMWSSPTSGESGEISLKQAFDFPTVYVNRNKMADLQRQRYGYEYQAARQEILLQAQECYIEIQMLRSIGRLMEDVADNARSITEAYRQKMDAGQANILELDEARFNMIGRDNALELNRAELQAAMERLAGLNGGEIIHVTDSLSDYIPGLPRFEKISEDYMRMSPELSAAMLAKMESEYDIKLSRSEGLPTFSLGYKHEFSEDDKAHGLIVGMSIPMFGNRNNVKRAKAQNGYAQAQLESTKNNIYAQLREMYAKLEVLHNSLERYDDILDTEKALQYIRTALDAGQISITEYFSKLEPVYESRLSVLELQREYLLTYARINAIYL